MFFVGRFYQTTQLNKSARSAGKMMTATKTSKNLSNYMQVLTVLVKYRPMEKQLRKTDLSPLSTFARLPFYDRPNLHSKALDCFARYLRGCHKAQFTFTVGATAINFF